MEVLKEHEETVGSDGCVHHRDCGSGFRHVKTHQIVHFKHVQFIARQLHPNKAVSAPRTTTTAKQMQTIPFWYSLSVG